jgi:hypothetical protein
MSIAQSTSKERAGLRNRHVARRPAGPTRPPRDGAKAAKQADVTLVTGGPAQAAHRTTSEPATHRKTTLFWNVAKAKPKDAR